MSTELTRKDLEDHYQRTQEENRKVLEILKEVSVQFNLIANQLVQIIKAQESILTSLVDRVQHPLEKTIEDTSEELRDTIERGSISIIKEGETNCSKCLTKIDQANENLKGINGKVDKIDETLIDCEKKRIKDRTQYVLIVTGLTAFFGLIATLLQIFVR